MQAPALNITAFFLGAGARHPRVGGIEWVDPITKEKPFQDPAKVTYMSSDRAYNLSYIQQYGACQPDLDVSTVNQFLVPGHQKLNLPYYRFINGAFRTFSSTSYSSCS